MQKRVALVKDNVVFNVIIIDDENAGVHLPEGVLAVENDWVGPGDWWEESEQRFYRALPTNDELENTAEEQSV